MLLRIYYIRLLWGIVCIVVFRGLPAPASQRTIVVAPHTDTHTRAPPGLIPAKGLYRCALLVVCFYARSCTRKTQIYIRCHTCEHIFNVPHPPKHPNQQTNTSSVARCHAYMHAKREAPGIAPERSPHANAGPRLCRRFVCVDLKVLFFE